MTTGSDAGPPARHPLCDAGVVRLLRGIGEGGRTHALGIPVARHVSVRGGPVRAVERTALGSLQNPGQFNPMGAEYSSASRQQVLFVNEPTEPVSPDDTLDPM